MLIGLTGGIGSGKTTVSNLFGELGIEIIDTDVISQNITAVGGSAIPLILETFGPQFIASNGSMDRKLMRAKVFDSAEDRKKLENILHPLIREEVKLQLQNLNGSYALLSVPLMNKESFWIRLCDRILLMDCPKEEQIRRVELRSGLMEAEIQKIIDSQSTTMEKLSFADDVIFNYGCPEKLKEVVHRLHQNYIILSGSCRN